MLRFKRDKGLLRMPKHIKKKKIESVNSTSTSSTSSTSVQLSPPNSTQFPCSTSFQLTTPSLSLSASPFATATPSATQYYDEYPEQFIIDQISTLKEVLFQSSCIFYFLSKVKSLGLNILTFISF